MAVAREEIRILRAVSGRILSQQKAWPCVRCFSSSSPVAQNVLNDVEDTTSFSTPPLSERAVQAFRRARIENTKGKKLPGSRYQYHPPRYNRGPLHPIQSPPSSDPTSREFVPGPFNFPRLKHTYDNAIAPDLLTLTYQHKPLGYVKPVSMKGQLREWDDSSPYYKNRPRRQPRGIFSDRLGLVEKDMTWHNLPMISAVSINSFVPDAVGDRDRIHVIRAVVQAISGEFPDVTKSTRSMSAWSVRANQKTGAKAMLRGGAAYEFVDKLVTQVLPKIKDWPGVKGSTGDRSGNLALGLKPEYMAYFPELEFNFDMYPAAMIPGCDIIIQTTATSDRHARLLFEALGFPFYGKVKK